MRYLSLFSGIGGFEVAIHRVFGHQAVCVGYSEIDKHAIAEYTRHYPTHRNLGDVRQIKKHEIDKLGKIDLVVAGFPCSDLSSMKHKARKGLDGDKSGLFWIMLDILSWVRNNNADVQIIIENNVSMAHKWRDMITEELSRVFRKPVYCNYFDASQWVPQRRRRYYWTLRPIPEYKGMQIRKLDMILDPLDRIGHLHVSPSIIRVFNTKYGDGKTGWLVDTTLRQIKNVHYRTRWKSILTVSSNAHAKCITTARTSNLLLDIRHHAFIIRYFSKHELNKLFGFPPNYIQTCSNETFFKLYGMSVVPKVIEHILKHMLLL